MPNLLATASQVANSLSNLKAKYIKYLETLCSANGIDISTLKTEGDAHTLLEMYFGGLPVLVGLKYFSQVSVLRLFGQQITCLKPLGEIAPTLEELWVCEGVLKDLSGVEHCVRLKKLFLYENSIEDASCLTALTSLQHLDLSANKLKNLTFLKNLKDLTNLSVANNNMKDSVMAAVFWPENIQHIDLSFNSFTTFKVLFPLTMLSSLRTLNINNPGVKSNASSNIFYAWIAHSFRFIESVDDDLITDQFVPTFRPMIDTILAEKMAKCSKIDEKHLKDMKLVEKHTAKIENRLACLADALADFRDSMQTKDAKKEIVKRVHEICVTNCRNVKMIQKNYNQLSDYNRTLYKYRLACELESCQTFILHDATAEQLAFISQTLNFSCSMKNCYEIIIKSCSMICEVSKNDAEKLFILEKDENDHLFDIRSIFRLLDRHHRSDYTKLPVKLIRDFEIIKKQSNEKTTIFFIPMVLSKTSTNRGETKIIDDEGMSTTSNDNVNWIDVRLVAVLMIEIQPVGQLTTDQLRFTDKFEESWADQLKKLNEMNIRIEIKDKVYRKHIEENLDSSISEVNSSQSKIRKVSDILANFGNLSGRACDETLPFEWFSIRSPLEISLAYFDFQPLREPNDLMRITSLDLSGQKITKLAGIPDLASLQLLSLKNNKISSLKKLMRLPALKFLNASFNHISKLEMLPTTLIYLDLSFNKLQSLSFSQNLQNVRNLRLQRNQIKSLKGLEGCNQLEIFIINDNLIKEKSELEVFKVLTKLTHLDISSNPISAQDGYKSKLMQFTPFLISLDRQIIPVEERHVSASKQTTRGLSLELVDRISPEWKNKQELMIVDQKIEQIIFEKSQLNELEHIRVMDLSKNKLSSVRELSALNITNLILNNNLIKCVAMDDGQLQPFKHLETLDLSSNNITHTTLMRLGIQFLRNLKSIDLSSNLINKFDCTIFDLSKLELIDLSNNLIKIIVRKPLKTLTILKLQNNRLTTLAPLSCPALIELDISNNRLASCASLKPLCESKSLEILNCKNNSVTERRVYVDFIKSQVPSVRQLDGEKMCAEVDVTKRRLSRANDIMSISRRNSMVTSSMLSWFEKQEEEIIDNGVNVTSFLETVPISRKPRRLEPIQGRKGKTEDGIGFCLLGIKAVQHKK